MMFLLDSCGNPVGFPRYFHDVSMVFLWDYYGNYLWNFFVVPMLFHVISMIFYGLSVGFLWGFHDISMICLWYYYRMSIESKLKSIEDKFKLN